MDTFKFYLFGDSICFGQHVDLHRIWATRISEKVNEKLNQYNKKMALRCFEWVAGFHLSTVRV